MNPTRHPTTRSRYLSVVTKEGDPGDPVHPPILHHLRCPGANVDQKLWMTFETI